MKTALISTLYNESGNLARWWKCIADQSARPDQIVIVDGGSKDGTWEQLQSLAQSSPVPVRLHQQRCNIAEGRNIAIRMCDADIIASSDAGSYPELNWFEQITQPLLADPEVDVVGGRSVDLVVNEFHKRILAFQQPLAEPQHPHQVQPSSRNVAFRRAAWASIGGYPEWLTLTAEDALFNYELHAVGCRFFYNRNAVVAWPHRDTPAAYFRMLHSYGYGSAEARLFGRNYVLSSAITVCPLLLLASRNRKRGFGFRYRKYLNHTTGWLAGKLFGRRAPVGWKRVNGVYLSPEAQATLARRGASA